METFERDGHGAGRDEQDVLGFLRQGNANEMEGIRGWNLVTERGYGRNQRRDSSDC